MFVAFREREEGADLFKKEEEREYLTEPLET